MGNGSCVCGVKVIICHWPCRQPTGWRAIHGESDGIPGLFVDVYGDAVSLQTTSEGADTRTPMFVDLLRERLLRHARQAVPDAGTAEDLVQDTLVDMIEGAARHRGEASLRTWAMARAARLPRRENVAFSDRKP